MADEFQTPGNWWDSSSRTRFETGASPPSSSLNSLGSFGWQPDMVDIKARSSMDSGSVSGTSSMVFHDTHKLQEGSDSASGGDPNLHMMALGLSSPATDWNQALFRGEKAETSFRSILQENMNSSTANFQQESDQQLQWRDKLFAGGCGDSSNEFKQMNRGFSLDQTQFSPQYSSGESTVTCQGLPSSFQMDSASAALYGSPSTILQGILGPHHDNQPQQPNSATINFPYQGNYGINNSSELLPSWSKVPQFVRTSPPKQPPHSHLQFSNNAPFWNAPHEAAMKDVRPSFFPSLQPQFPTARFDEKPKNISEVQESGAVGKKSGSEVVSKRPRNETSSPLPAFKVRKEKMGDRITALQQLVSPFGKVLSTPYMKSGTAIQHQQQMSDKSKDPDGPKQDLSSRGLCLVPVSSTFPVTHETTVDFWTPTFGGTYR
nr:transcription factor bHLH123-like isoform X3 [Malus domestica]